ncbi:uncharacterized protein [Periplaneta americana]|uniref:uncharacterized protein isoform X3 n=1 Tax=Periplaneta americana TaxID=6978 RepID=UPI0037E9600E
MAEVLRAIARVVYLVVVVLYLALVGNCCVCEPGDVDAVMRILSPDDALHNSQPKHVIRAPSRCASDERRDHYGRCRKVF